MPYPQCPHKRRTLACRECSPQTCPTCHKLFSTQSFKNHQKKECGKPKYDPKEKMTCSMCRKIFSVGYKSKHTCKYSHWAPKDDPAEDTSIELEFEDLTLNPKASDYKKNE